VLPSRWLDAHDKSISKRQSAVGWRHLRFKWRNFGAVYETAPVLAKKMAQFTKKEAAGVHLMRG
jgi:hypothetical protein